MYLFLKKNFIFVSWRFEDSVSNVVVRLLQGFSFGLFSAITPIFPLWRSQAKSKNEAYMRSIAL